MALGLGTKIELETDFKSHAAGQEVCADTHDGQVPGSSEVPLS